jgi:hypothetical protein
MISPNDCIVKIKWSICRSEHRNLFTIFGQKSILVSHGFTQLGNEEDTCAIIFVASKLYLFPIATRYKNVPHTDRIHTSFCKNISFAQHRMTKERIIVLEVKINM